MISIHEYPFIVEAIVTQIKNGQLRKVDISGPPGCGKMYLFLEEMKKQKVPYFLLESAHILLLNRNELKAIVANACFKSQIIVLDATDLQSEWGPTFSVEMSAINSAIISCLTEKKTVSMVTFLTSTNSK